MGEVHEGILCPPSVARKIIHGVRGPRGHAAFKNQGGIFCINHVVLLYAAAYDVHMGLLDALRSLTGPKAPRLATPEAGAPVVEVGHLEVHTAGTLLIVVTDSSGAAALR